MSKQKYKKEMKIVIFLLVLYPLAKCFYSVFTLPLSGFVWKNNNPALTTASYSALHAQWLLPMPRKKQKNTLF